MASLFGDDGDDDAEDASPTMDETMWDTAANIAALKAELRSRVSGPVTAKTPAMLSRGLHVLFEEEGVLRRYLIARKGHIKRAADMLLRTQEWRFTVTPDWPTRGVPISEGLIERVGVQVAQVRGCDKLGRPLVLMRPRLHDPSSGDRDVLKRSIVFTLDEVVARLERPPHFPTQFVTIFDLKDFSRANADIDFAKCEIQTAANHFPERLGAVYLINTSWLFWAVYKLISPFIDARTRAKIRFLDGNGRKELAEAFDDDQLPVSLGGKLPDSIDVTQIFPSNAATSTYVSLREGPLPPSLQRAWAAAQGGGAAAAASSTPAAGK